MAQAAQKVYSLSIKALLRDGQGRCLLLRRSATCKNNAGKWELPGGKLDPGEDFDAGLRREVREETGLDIELERPFESTMSDLTGRQVVYLVMLADAKTTNVQLSHEHDSYQWADPGVFEDIDFCRQFRGVARHYRQFVKSQQPPAPPTPSPALVTPAKLDTFLNNFKQAKSKHEQLKEFLVGILEERIKQEFPLATVGGRVKGLVSFADKTVKKAKYLDPVADQTDLTGLRVVVHLPSEVEAVGRIIRQMFHIDEANSLDTLSRLGPDKFGYRSVHYIVEILPDKPASAHIPANLQGPNGKAPTGLVGLKAEIQVRTIAQHAWSDIGHDRLYKGACEVSDYWKREANRVAALLEAADEEFQRLVDGISFYEAHRPHCPAAAATLEAIELTRVIRSHAPKDLNLALRHARLAADIEDWNEVIAVAKDPNLDPRKKPMLMALYGYALFKNAQNDAERQAGYDTMEEAAEIAVEIAEPRLLFARAYAEQRRNLDALAQYLLAFEAEPGNPEALIGLIRQKAASARDAEFISIAKPGIQSAIARCRQLAAAHADLPRARYRIAEFLLLLGPAEESESLATFAQAVQETDSPDALLRALADVDLLAKCEPGRQDIECARRFLAAALQARFPGTPLPQGVTLPKAETIAPKGRFVIVAGGCDPHIQINIQTYRDLLTKAFADFDGIVISGGTEQGVSGLVGEIAQSSKGHIYALGYLPPQLPADNTASVDNRYDETRKTDSKRFFSATEAVQVWLDLLASDVHPRDVRLLGINGGLVAGLEYRFALAMGAKVGLLQNSGREAERLLQEWPPEETPNLLVLPKDPMAVRAFLHVGLRKSKLLTGSIVTKAAKQVHEDFLDQQRYSHPDPVMQPWAKLRSDLKESNRNQVEYLEDILRAHGFGIRPASTPLNDPEFTKAEVDYMAEMEHGRWALERAASGWTYGPKKDAEKKISPYLVSWDELEDNVREYDRKNVRVWPELLADAGLEIYRLP